MGQARVVIDGMQLRLENGGPRTIRQVLPALAWDGAGFEALVVSTWEAAPMLAPFDVELVAAPQMSSMLWDQYGLPSCARRLGVRLGLMQSCA